MKKELPKKLVLTKTTVRQLQETMTDDQLKAVAGGQGCPMSTASRAGIGC